MRYPWIDEYLCKKPGVRKDHKEEWNWTRYMIADKLFCAICLDDSNAPYYITMKQEPARADMLRQQYPDIIPGYYMNKQHWNSVKADGDVPDALMEEMLDDAYKLVLKGFSKKRQAEILGK